MQIDEITSKIEEMQNLGFESTNKIEKINSEIGITKERIQNNKNNQKKRIDICVIGAGIVAGIFFGLFGDDFEITKDELKEIEDYLIELDITNGYIQELGEHEEEYVPDF